MPRFGRSRIRGWWREGALVSKHVGSVAVAPAGSVTGAPAALAGHPPRPTYRIVLMRACDLRVGDIVRRLEVERPDWHGTGWRTVSPYSHSIVGPDRAVWTCDLASDDVTLWEVQVRD